MKAYKSTINTFFLFLLYGIICLLLIFYRSTQVLANGQKTYQPWWLEIGADFGYQKTDFWFKVQENFYKSIFSTKGGYRFNIFEKNLNTRNDSKVSLYIDPYFKAELLADLGNKGQNTFFWNNNIKYGPGIRLRTEYKVPESNGHKFRLDYINLDYFAEYLHINFIDRGEAIPSNIPRNDFRGGFNSWSFADSKFKPSPESNFEYGVWFNMWNELTYSSTLFFLKGESDFFIITLSPKAGLRLDYKGIAIEPYYRLDFVRDLFDKDWNREAWSNNTRYGPGLRLSLGGLLQRENPNMWKNSSIFLYAEYLDADYHSRVGGKAVGRADYDFRAGMNLWIPFGASRGSRSEAR